MENEEALASPAREEWSNGSVQLALYISKGGCSLSGCSEAVIPAMETFMCHAVGWRGEGERSGFPGARVLYCACKAGEAVACQGS